MKSEKGVSLIVLVISIIVLIILSAITINSTDNSLDNSIEAKKAAEAKMDDEKIKELITYELAGTYDLIDVEIDLKRIVLADTLQIEYEGITYGEGYTLYLSDEDVKKVEQKTGMTDYYKSYKDITKSYVVNSSTGDFKRLEEDWEF